MYDKVKNYILDSSFKLILNEDGVYIANYKDILLLDNNKVVVELFKKKVIIVGKNIVLQTLLDKELYFDGNIEKIEVLDV